MTTRLVISATCALALSGCVLSPEGAIRDNLREAGMPKRLAKCIARRLANNLPRPVLYEAGGTGWMRPRFATDSPPLPPLPSYAAFVAHARDRLAPELARPIEEATAPCASRR